MSTAGTGGGMRRRAWSGLVQHAGVRVVDVLLSVSLILLSLPLVVAIAVAIRIDDRGPVFFRTRRVGRNGNPFMMLKFRKMRMGADGPPLTVVSDVRFTRLGHFLAGTKLDELPQLWNVLRGQMSLVGPRPEDPALVARDPALFAGVLSVKPGITGYAQLAYAREGEILADADGDERIDVYFDRVLPQKLALDRLYAHTASLSVYVRVLWWTVVAVVLRKSVAVNRVTGRLGLRRRPQEAIKPAETVAAPLPAPEADSAGTAA